MSFLDQFPRYQISRHYNYIKQPFPKNSSFHSSLEDLPLSGALVLPPNRAFVAAEHFCCRFRFGTFIGHRIETPMQKCVLPGNGGHKLPSTVKSEHMLKCTHGHTTANKQANACWHFAILHLVS